MYIVAGIPTDKKEDKQPPIWLVGDRLLIKQQEQHYYMARIVRIDKKLHVQYDIEQVIEKISPTDKRILGRAKNLGGDDGFNHPLTEKRAKELLDDPDARKLPPEPEMEPIEYVSDKKIQRAMKNLRSNLRAHSEFHSFDDKYGKVITERNGSRILFVCHVEFKTSPTAKMLQSDPDYKYEIQDARLSTEGKHWVVDQIRKAAKKAKLELTNEVEPYVLHPNMREWLDVGISIESELLRPETLLDMS